MTITPTTLTRVAGTAAVTAGLVFIGVQIGHPHLDAESVTTTEMAVRSSLKLLMASLALVGITGMYLRQVKEVGVLGLVGYVVYAAGYLLIAGSAFVSAFVLPTVAQSNPGVVDDILDVSSGRTTAADVGLFAVANQLQGLGYLVGGLLFGIALYRARVLSRWASALLAASGVVTVTLTLLPDAFYRLLAYPNGIAMIALGYSLWRTTRTAAENAEASAPHLSTAGAR